MANRDLASGLFSSPAKRTFVLCLMLMAATLVLYSPVTHSTFVNFDDDAYIIHNAHVRAGLTWTTVKWSFTQFEEGNWHPLTWLSHALDIELFGLNPAGHHLVNVFLARDQCCDSVLPVAKCDWFYMAQSDGGGAVCGSSGQRGIGGVGRGAKKCPQYVFLPAGAAGLRMVCAPAATSPLRFDVVSVSAGPDEQAAGHYVSFSSSALGLLASAPHGYKFSNGSFGPASGDKAVFRLAGSSWKKSRYLFCQQPAP